MSTSKTVQSGTQKKTCWDVSICPHILHCSSPGQFLFTNCSADGRQSEYKDHRKNLIFNGILALHMLMISLFSSPVKVSSLYNDAIVKLPFLSSAQVTVSGSSCNQTPLTCESKSCHSSISAVPKDLLKVRFTPLSCNTSYTVLFCSLQIM